MQCLYCPKDGDSVEMQEDRLDKVEIEQMVGAALDAGFSDFSITGGEPLLNDQTVQQTCGLARYINHEREARGYVGYTKLNTNGANLLKYRDEVAGARFDELKVSLDTLDPATFKALNGRSERVLQDTIAGILTLKDTVPIRLQTVVGRYNVDELPNLIKFCRSNGLSLKLFDISRYDNALAGSGQFCDDNYVALGEISERLEREFGEPTIKYAVGGYGHPKKVFATPEGTKIEVRDTAMSAQYSSELCETCPKYMCQDGLCNLVIAADGHVRFCREGGTEQTLPTIDQAGQRLPTEAIRGRFIQAAGIFAAARSIERPIQPIRRLLPLTVVRL
jgi:molybdenum cofactor biosynthesis enzyme MoaA